MRDQTRHVPARATGGRPRRRLVALAGVVLVVTSLLGITGANPAGATPNENFVDRVYTDFLYEEPTAAEMTWWTTFLAGGGSRSALVANVFDTVRFKDLWVIGLQLRYLRLYDEAQADAALAALVATDDFHATEISTLASSTYFSRAGSTNTGYVTNLYDDVLRRPVDSGSLSYWVGRLNAGTSTRSSVARFVLLSSEGIQRRVAGDSGMTACPTAVSLAGMATPSGAYCLILERVADAPSTAYWVSQLSGSSTHVPTLWISLAASQEYFDNAQ